MESNRDSEKQIGKKTETCRRSTHKETREAREERQKEIVTDR